MDRYITRLAAMYSSYGLSKTALRAMFHLGLQSGYDVKTIYNLLKVGLSERYETAEIFSLRDISSVTGADTAAVIMAKNHSLFEIWGLTEDVR